MAGRVRSPPRPAVHLLPQPAACDPRRGWPSSFHHGRSREIPSLPRGPSGCQPRAIPVTGGIVLLPPRQAAHDPRCGRPPSFAMASATFFRRGRPRETFAAGGQPRVIAGAACRQSSASDHLRVYCTVPTSWFLQQNSDLEGEEGKSLKLNTVHDRHSKVSGIRTVFFATLDWYAN